MNTTESPAAIRYCVTDTESSGLMDFKLPADHPSQPRLAEVSMIRLNEDLTVSGYYHAYIKPDGWVVSAEANAVNGLTTEFLMEHGKPIAEVLAVYSQIVNEGYIIAAFNAQFDLKMYRSELRRAGMPDLFEKTPNVCVMRSAMGRVVKQSGKGGFPKLSDCCAHFNIDVEAKLHGAQGDAERCYRVLLQLDSIGALQAPAVHTSKNKEAIEAAGRGEVPAAPKPGDFDAPAAPRSVRSAKAKPAAVSAGDEIPE